MQFDQFTFDLERTHWLFTFALGIPLGLGLAGVWLALRGGRANRWPGAALLGIAAIFGLLAAATPVDQLPLNFVDLKLKLYLSVASVSAVLVVALVLGAAAGALPLLFRLVPAHALRSGWLAVGVHTLVATVVLAGALAWTDAEADPDRHPARTDTGDTVGATKVIDDAAMVTGLVVAPTGELVYVELLGRRLVIAGGGEPRSIALPLGDGEQSLHVALHPGWPTTPYAFISAEQRIDGRPHLQVLRVRTDGVDDITPVIEQLPMTEPSVGNHFGSAIGFCGDAFYLTVGDNDAVFTRPSAELRARAQLLSGAEGKVLRYRLEGIDLNPDGLANANPPINAVGFRNPFAMACLDGLPLVADNGDFSHDQVRLVQPGSNHEWPFTYARNAFSKPLFDTGDMTIAPAGIATRERGGAAEVVLGGFRSEAIYLLTLDSEGRLRGNPRLLREVEYGALAIAADSRGCIYFSDPFGIWRLDEEGCNGPR